MPSLTRRSRLRPLVTLTTFAALLPTASGLARPSSAYAASAPIVAVFDIEDKGAGLSAEVRSRLTAYLASSLTATGRFQVVPRAQIKARLRAQKHSSYKKCFDQSCQIEIGKELAAQKSLATQVLKLGSRCAVAATLYDLRRAATERAATVRGGCSEDAIVSSLEAVVKRLGGSGGKAPPAAPPPPDRTPHLPPPSTGPRVFIDVRSEPAGAEVFVDGRPAGRTPLRLAFAKGKPVELTVEREGYLTRRAHVLPNRRTTLRYALELDARGGARMAQRTEWIGVELAVGGGAIEGSRDSVTDDQPVNASGVFCANLTLFTIKWRRFFWTLLEGGAGYYFSDRFNASWFTRFGYPMYLSADGTHQLRFGVGFGAMIINDTAAFTLSPTAHYMLQTSGHLYVGFGLRLNLPVAGADRTTANSGSTEYVPAMVLLSVMLGWIGSA
ncbi:MAG: PEGA domain-containing protein [Myxococcales bacterium]|nr:PEGA domain-containing protein [Myxococcales bacterium]